MISSIIYALCWIYYIGFLLTWLILDTYCVQYPNGYPKTVPFFEFFQHFHTAEPLYLQRRFHLGGFRLKNALYLLKYGFFLFMPNAYTAILKHALTENPNIYTWFLKE